MNRGFIFVKKRHNAKLFLVSSLHLLFLCSGQTDESNTLEPILIVLPAIDQMFYVPTMTDSASITLKFHVETIVNASKNECYGAEITVSFDELQLLRYEADAGEYSFDDIAVTRVGKHSFHVALIDREGVSCATAVRHFRVVEARLQVDRSRLQLAPPRQ